MQHDRAEPEAQNADFGASGHHFPTRQTQAKQSRGAEIQRQGEEIHDRIGHNASAHDGTGCLAFEVRGEISMRILQRYSHCR
jgi:hypothetical protein